MQPEAVPASATRPGNGGQAAQLAVIVTAGVIVDEFTGHSVEPEVKYRVGCLGLWNEKWYNQFPYHDVSGLLCLVKTRQRTVARQTRKVFLSP